MESENGWIMPDGKYIECHFNDHIRCAEEDLGTKEEALEKTAVKVSCLPRPLQVVIVGNREYCPHFLTARMTMTKQQLKTIEEYCVCFKYRPPIDFFLQLELREMIDLSTTNILSILESK
jgi:hypothetical protein